MWPRLAAAALGVWLMAAPAVLGYGGAASTSQRIAGPIVAAIAVVAMTEATRPLRWANLVTAAWLVVAPAVVAHDGTAAAVSMAAGALVGALACVRGRRRARLGGGWRAIVRPGVDRPAGR